MPIGRLRCCFAKTICLSLLGLALIGCGESDSYPSTLTYGVRNDLMVAGNIKSQPVKFNNPGQMPLDFLKSPQIPKKYDADKKTRVIDYAKLEQLAKNGTLKLSDNDRALLEESKTNIIDPDNLTPAERNKIGEILTKLFGTPANPTVKVKSGSDEFGVAPEVVEILKLKDDVLRDGSRLYRRHCLHCHGLEGNGRGPTGYWVDPHPRDYRQGIFKFTSSSQDLGERKPRRDDLMHVLVHGIEGTSMPSFAAYGASDLDKIISYVIHLSLRGEVEFYVISQWITGDSGKLPNKPTAEEIEAVRASMHAEGRSAQEIQDTVKKLNEIPQPSGPEVESALKAMEGKFAEGLEAFTARWIAAQTAAIQPEAYPYPENEDAFLASAMRGAKLFTTGSASCISCHKNFGREAPYSFDSWGTIVRPRNLIDGYYRGGRRPIDLYFRVFSGINGAGMTNYSTLKDSLKPSDLYLDDKSDPEKVKQFDENQANITRLQEELRSINVLWDLVNFMQALHYPDLRAKLKDKGVVID